MQQRNLQLLFLAFAIFIGYNATIIAQDFNGFALFNEPRTTNVFLVDKDGEIAHTWSPELRGNYAVLLKENGNLVRGGIYTNQLKGAAASGIIQELDPASNIVWEFVYSDANHCSHHDITLLPNGNVILTAWEVKTSSELVDAGFDNPTGNKWPTHFIEVQQEGQGGKIVWEWHIWDHLIQDTDSTLKNFGVVADHPELMDINAILPSRPARDGDWFHVNGVDYNEELDQLVFSSRLASEIFIIDHSTTTEEAASHNGGNAGKGGDFLYRWGNPANYNSTGPRTIPSAVHDPRWITDDGRPNGGYIQLFNNEGAGPRRSAVDAINPIRNGYNYVIDGDHYGPDNYEWRHNCEANATGQSAHNRMSNGNTFVNVSRKYMYEVDSNNNVVWQYAQGPSKAFRYECDHPGLHVIFNGAHPTCPTVNTEDNAARNILISPNPSYDIFTIRGVDNVEDISIDVYNIYGTFIFNEMNNSIDMTSYNPGTYFLSIKAKNTLPIIKKITLIK